MYHKIKTCANCTRRSAFLCEKKIHLHIRTEDVFFLPQNTTLAGPWFGGSTEICTYVPQIPAISTQQSGL